jgi:hypothetical protein
MEFARARAKSTVEIVGFDDGDEFGIVGQIVVAYGTPLGAHYGASLEWAGLLQHKDIPYADASESYESSFADESHMICQLAQGVVDACSQWRYVAAMANIRRI